MLKALSTQLLYSIFKIKMQAFSTTGRRPDFNKQKKCTERKLDEFVPLCNYAVSFLDKKDYFAMENAVIFLATVLFYFGVWWLFICPAFTAFTGVNHTLKYLGIISVLCLPFNINGNVYTVLGNGESEKNMYSVFSITEQDRKS